MEAWTAETVGEFLRRSRAEADRYAAAWELLATTGMRRGEALGLRWSDIDLDACVASITQTVILVDHVIQFGTPKTKAGNRSVDLDPGTVAALRGHRKRQAEERLLMGAGWIDHDLVFCKVTAPQGGTRTTRPLDDRDNTRHVLARDSRHAA